MGIGGFAGPHHLHLDVDTRDDSAQRPEPMVFSAHPEALDLLKDFAELKARLSDAASAGSWDDAFLFAAGLHQIVEDWLHDPWSSSIVRKRVLRHGGLGAAADSRRDLVPVPYDFDSSGFVNAPYALPPAGVPVMMMSPGSSATISERLEMISGTFQISWLRSPSWRSVPLHLRVILPLVG